MTSSMRPDGLLPTERFGPSHPTGADPAPSSWSDLPRQARSVGSTTHRPAPAAPPSAPDPAAPADARTTDGRPTRQQAPVTAPPVARPHAVPPPAGPPPVGPPAGPQPRPAEPGPEAAEPRPDAEPDGGGSWTLVKACQAGDQDAFKELYARYHEVVFRYVLFRLGDRTLAEDLTQETFLRALRRIGSVSYQGRDIGAWFVTIARNLIFDHVKSSRYRLESTTADMVEHSPSTHGPEQQVIENATNSELLKAIEKLNPDQQDCIRMRFLQGLSVAETAQRMNRAEGAVKALQHRAVRRLAQLLPEGLR